MLPHPACRATVVWQALKYVAYCSSLKKAEIVEIYQKYLDRWFNGESAVPNLCEFLDVEDLDDTVLNAGSDQRLILVAANFRKEVTATVLWLIGHEIRAQCFRAVPYSFGEELLIDLRRAFWTRTLEELRRRGIARYENISPSKDHWLASATGVSGCAYNLIFLKSAARVELSRQRSEAGENKWIYDRLEGKKQEIEDRFGADLKWQRLPDKKMSRVSYAHPFDGYHEDNWLAMIEWLCKHIVNLEHAFSEPLARLNRRLKSHSAKSAGGQGDSQ